MIQPTRYKVRPWMPTPQQQAYVREIAPTRAFLHNLPEEIRGRHAGEWIAARDCQIVATARTLEVLFAMLPDRHDPSVLFVRIERGVTIRWSRC